MKAEIKHNYENVLRGYNKVIFSNIHIFIYGHNVIVISLNMVFLGTNIYLLDNGVPKN